MRIFRDADTPAKPVDLHSFVGPATTKLLASGEAPAVHVYRVVFQPGGRTNWHIHSGVQWLFVVEGRIRFQSQGGAIEEVASGDAVMFEPGEKHWHGAPPGAAGVHLAVNIDVQTQWLEPVLESEYRGS